MTNYEKLFKEQMKDPNFSKAYYEARIDRMLNELFENLREKISHNEPKDVLLKTIDIMQRQIGWVYHNKYVDNLPEKSMH